MTIDRAKGSFPGASGSTDSAGRPAPSADGDAPRVVLAGGGTGGHLAPGVALAEALVRLDERARIFFLVAGREIEASFLGDGRFGWESLGDPSRGGGPLGKGWGVGRSFCRSFAVLQREKPQVMVGLGGGASVGPILASRVARRPRIVLLEQNATPGRATRILARLADRIHLAFPLPELSLPARVDARLSGNPVRSSTRPLPRGEAIRRLGLDPDRRTLVVLGGSQGARSLNARVTAAVGDLGPALAGIQIVHVSGRADEDCVARAYSARGVDGHVLAFCQDMGALYGAADLLLSRAGGTTVAEILQGRVPSILVPYPWHRDRHQFVNARRVEEAGLGVLVEEAHLGADFFRRVVIPRLHDVVRSSLPEGDAPVAAADIVARDVLELASASPVGRIIRGWRPETSGCETSRSRR